MLFTCSLAAKIAQLIRVSEHQSRGCGFNLQFGWFLCFLVVKEWLVLLFQVGKLSVTCKEWVSIGYDTQEHG